MKTIEPDDPRLQEFMERYEPRRQQSPNSNQDNGQLYLWLFLGVPGAFIGAYKAFKRNDQVMGKRLTKIGVAMMIGFCLFFGFISWRISENTKEVARAFEQEPFLGDAQGPIGPGASVQTAPTADHGQQPGSRWPIDMPIEASAKPDPKDGPAVIRSLIEFRRQAMCTGNLAYLGYFWAFGGGAGFREDEARLQNGPNCTYVEDPRDLIVDSVTYVTPDELVASWRFVDYDSGQLYRVVTRSVISLGPDGRFRVVNQSYDG